MKQAGKKTMNNPLLPVMDTCHVKMVGEKSTKVLVSGLRFLCYEYLRWGFERVQLDGSDHVLEEDLFGECVPMIDDWISVRPVPRIHCVVRKYSTLCT